MFKSKITDDTINIMQSLTFEEEKNNYEKFETEQEKLDNFFKNLNSQDEVQEILFQLLCEHCNKHTLKEIEGKLTCTNCGISMDNLIIDQGCDWRYYRENDSRGQDPSRCGMPTSVLLPNSSNSTTISGGRNKLNIIQNYMVGNHKERELIKVFSDLENRCMRAGICKAITNKAQFYFKDVKTIMEENSDIKRSSNREGLIGACLYNACRKFGNPKRTKEIANIMGIEDRYVTNGIKIFGEIYDKKKIKIYSRSSNAQDFVISFCSKLEFDEKLTKLIQKIIKCMLNYHVATDHASESQTAGAIWYVIKKCGYEKSLSKSTIADKVKVSEVTISRAYDKISQADQKTSSPVKGYFSKYIKHYLRDLEKNNTKSFFFVDNEADKPKKKRGRKPKIKISEETPVVPNNNNNNN